MVLDSILPHFAELIKDSTKYAVIPITQHISYAFKSDNIVEKLREQTERLVNKLSRLQISVDKAERNGEQIRENVTNWLDSAQTEIKKAELLFRRMEAAKNCCFGLCPSLMTRYQLSMKAGKEMGAIEELLNESELYPVSFRTPPRQIFEPSVYGLESLPSRVVLLNQVMDALKDPNLNMIGVYGMGGIGKTTLAKEVHRKAVECKLFDYVVMVAVGRTPDLRRIQGEIAEFLGLQLDVQSLTARAILLHRTLKKSEVLIILDDIWAKLDLRSVGIPFGDGDERAKILLTSRNKNVLCREMGTQKDFLLEVLPEGEAWRLFKMNAGGAENRKFQAIATEVANKCAGLPLLILMVASDLRNKKLYEWNDMLNRLSEFRNEEIYESLPSRVLLLNQVMDALKDPNFNMIGVYGMGGIGKTTLAKEVHRKAVECKLFDYVVMVAVSRTPDLRRIQGEIAEFLGLQLDVQSLTTRAILLRWTLQKSKVLIILDDIWEKLDLRSVGIPFGDGDERAKILLTSRSKNVLCREMGTQIDFLLEVLPEGEAWRLFKTNVAEAENAKFQAIATKVCNKCVGFPLLIQVVASDLRNKELYEWNDMLNRLSEFRNEEIHEPMYRVIKLSYENLIGNQLKSFFLLCGLYGRNNNIQIRDLVRCSMGLGLLKDMRTIEDARNRVFGWISELKSRSLLLDGDMVGYVKMHEVVHETVEEMLDCGSGPANTAPEFLFLIAISVIFLKVWNVRRQIYFYYSLKILV